MFFRLEPLRKCKLPKYFPQGIIGWLKPISASPDDFVGLNGPGLKTLAYQPVPFTKLVRIWEQEQGAGVRGQSSLRYGLKGKSRVPGPPRRGSSPLGWKVEERSRQTDMVLLSPRMPGGPRYPGLE
jgi:hypothetical protein